MIGGRGADFTLFIIPHNRVGGNRALETARHERLLCKLVIYIFFTLPVLSSFSLEIVGIGVIFPPSALCMQTAALNCLDSMT